MIEFNNGLLVPTSICIKLIDTTGDFLSLAAKQKLWAPFHAACFLSGLKPGSIVGGVGTAYFPSSGNDNHKLDADYEEQVKGLTQVLVFFNKGKPLIESRSAVEWALKNGIISTSDPLVSLLNGDFQIHAVNSIRKNVGIQNVINISPAFAQDEANIHIAKLISEISALKFNAKETGKHWFIQQSAILSAALHQLATNRGACEDRNGHVVATRITRQVDDHRAKYGFKTENTPTHDTILLHIRKALQGVKLDDPSST